MASAVQRQTLLWLLVINAVMFAVELTAGLWAESMGLVADSLDMLADAGVYAVALLAVGGTVRQKTHAATASGLIQLTLAAWLTVELAQRAVRGSEPVSLVMIGVSFVALAANTACLVLLRKHRQGEIHMRASWIFSTTDVQVNVAVILAGVLVMLTGSAWPDLLIGLAVCWIVVRGGVRILRQARASYSSLRAEPGPAPN